MKKFQSPSLSLSLSLSLFLSLSLPLPHLPPSDFNEDFLHSKAISLKDQYQFCVFITYWYVFLSVCLFFCLSVFLLVCLSVCLFVCFSIRLFVYLSVCLFVYLSVCVFFYNKLVCELHLNRFSFHQTLKNFTFLYKILSGKTTLIWS
jgi:hypothetical protein